MKCPATTSDATSATGSIMRKVSHKSRGPLDQARLHCCDRAMRDQSSPLFCAAILPWYMKMEWKIHSNSSRQNPTLQPTLQHFLSVLIGRPKPV